MIGKSVNFLYTSIGMCQIIPGYRAAWYFVSNESRKRALDLAKDVVAERAPDATIYFTTGDIRWPNGSVIMLRVADGAVGDEVHKVEIDTEDEYESISDWVYEYYKSRERLCL
jgi:hypothetical protein